MRPGGDEQVGGEMSWDREAKLCANCRFWPLSGYGETVWKNDYGRPSGISGFQTDGSVSDCRRHAPTELNQERRPGETAIWPRTLATDYCGDFERRELPQGVKQIVNSEP